MPSKKCEVYEIFINTVDRTLLHDKGLFDLETIEPDEEV
jgi:hypothetical protein